MKIYTKTGDRGETSLLSGQRVSKDSVRVDAYGTLDEANAALGLAKSLTENSEVIGIIHRLQGEIISLCADLATEGELAGKKYRITEEQVTALEELIDKLEKARFPQKAFGFVLPGNCSSGAALDLSRTIVRRGERLVIRLQKLSDVHLPVLLYLNRLSDLLFVLARYVEQEELVAVVTAKVLKALSHIGTEPDNKKGDKLMLEKAKKMIAAAEQKAVEIKVPMVITVVDGGGNLVAQHRMDDALLASIAISRDKAYTAVALKMSTQTAWEVSQPGQSLYGLNTTDGCRLVVFGGGLPILENGRVVGAIGVSGGAVNEDVSVAEAGLSAW